MSVNIRKRQLADGKSRLYLDIYIAGEPRQYRWLDLFIIPEKSSVDKHSNKITRHLADEARLVAEKEILTAPKAEKKKGPDFIELFDEVSRQRTKSFRSVLRWIIRFEAEMNESMNIRKIDEQWLERFKEFLIVNVHQNTAHTYFQKIGNVLDAAVARKIVSSNVARRVKGIPEVGYDTEYVTLQEISKLAQTPLLKYPEIKRAFLFGCLTGLRLSDIIALRHSDIILRDSGYVINIVPIKTKKTNVEPLYLPLNADVMKLLGNIKQSDDPVFDLPSPRVIPESVRAWARDAGIHRHLKFHSARHTFATMIVKKTGNLKLAASLLHHSEKSGTKIVERYAHVDDDDRRNAVTTSFASITINECDI